MGVGGYIFIYYTYLYIYILHMYMCVWCVYGCVCLYSPAFSLPIYMYSQPNKCLH